MMVSKRLWTLSLILFAAVGCSDTDPGDTEDPNRKPPVTDDEKRSIVINEVTSSGSDRVEFLNIGDETVDISGWFYTDSKQDIPTAYTFPAGTTLAPGEYLVTNKEEHHTFGLGASDGVMLFSDENQAIDVAAWVDGMAEVSWCRLPNGTGDFQSCARPTFGYENTEVDAVCGNGLAEEPSEFCDGDDLAGATCASHGFTGGELGCLSDCSGFDTSACTGRVSTVVINEVTAKGSDDIEFFNTGDVAVDISGWRMTDDNRTRDDAYIFPEGTVLEAGDYLVLSNPVDFPFGIGKQDEVNLFDENDVLVDHTGWAADDAEVSWCRLPNGTGAFQVCPQATFGSENTDEAPPEPVCGDGEVTGNEVCDGTNLNGVLCEDFGYAPGELACASDCLGFDVTLCGDKISDVVINEVTAKGSDDIEFFNRGTEPVDLSGWRMTDDNLERLDAYIFPEGTVIAPGAYIVLSNPDDFGFGIGKEDAVHLYDADDVLMDATFWPADAAEVSWCRIPNGWGEFQSCSEQSFGSENVHVSAPEAVCGDGEIAGEEVCDGTNLNGALCEDFGYAPGELACASDCLGFDVTLCGDKISDVVINEVTAKGSDDIEFFNRGTEPVDLSGWRMTDDNLERLDAYIFPEGTVIAPGAYIVLSNPDDFGFGIGKEDAVHLYDADDVLMDATFWPVDAAEVSWCRLPNGWGEFQSCEAQTFGQSND